MSPPVPGLPEYKSPPVIEVVCGVQFEPLPGLLSVHFGGFWSRVRGRYPKSEDRPPLEEIRETDRGTEVKTELMEMPPLRRVFYVDATGNFLLQVQPSRFLSNWRKERHGDEYPRYSTAFQRFCSGWNDFVEFLTETSLGTPRSNQYELTYINHIVEGATPFPAGIEHYLPLLAWRSARSAGFLPSPRVASLIGSASAHRTESISLRPSRVSSCGWVCRPTSAVCESVFTTAQPLAAHIGARVLICA